MSQRRHPPDTDRMLTVEKVKQGFEMLRDTMAHDPSPTQHLEFPPDAICRACAERMGLKPVPYAVGVWLGTCDFCGQAADLRSRVHDYEAEDNA